MTKGDVYFLDDIGEGHYYFVITDADSEGNHLIVNMTTYNGYRSDDTTCILKVGDHPVVTRDSFIAYRHAKLVTDEDLVKIGSRKCVPNITSGLLQRIQKGSRYSPHYPEKFNEYHEFF